MFWLTSQMPTTFGLGQAEAKSVRLCVGLTCGWPDCTVCPITCVSRKLVSGIETGLELRHANMGCGYHKIFTMGPNAYRT